MTDAVLVAEDLTKRFPVPGTGRLHPETFLAVNDVSFRVREGECLGLVGESGSGKSTIARLLLGSLIPDSGTVSVQGQLRRGKPRRRTDRLRRAREVQMVFQDPYLSLDPRLTPQAAIKAVLKLHGQRDPDRRNVQALAALEQVGLGPREAKALPRHLSGGQRQRVAIARALAIQPDVLVLDEAVAELDVSIQAQILKLIRSLREDLRLSIVFISHDLAVVRHIADQVVVLQRGKVVDRGETSTVFRSPSHPYTQLLLGSIPSPGWDPRSVIRHSAAADD